jgi:hypothetical protein
LERWQSQYNNGNKLYLGAAELLLLGENDACVKATPIVVDSSFTGNLTLASVDVDLELYCELFIPPNPGIW